MSNLTTEELRPLRLEIALSLIDSTHPDAPKILQSLAETDPVIGRILSEYGVV